MAKILVVEDELLSCSLLELTLQNAGHQVCTAADGAQALAAAQADMPDMIITDVMMPVMDGFELCRQCKADPVLQNLPIILYSHDYVDLHEQKFGLELGASRYLIKPTPPEVLIETVNETLREHWEKERAAAAGATPLDSEMKLLKNYNEVLFNKLVAKMQELEDTIKKHQQTEESLKLMQAQVIQQEKLASIGQLAAGVAHEINNPIGFISSNLTSLEKYGERLDTYLAALQKSLLSCAHHAGLEELNQLRQTLKIDYIISDIKELVKESLDGASRVQRIVQNLKSFSRIDQKEVTRTNLNEALETTITIAWNELKYIATLERDFGDIPDILCNPQQINQVFLNLLVNAAQAMDKPGIITVRTWADHDMVHVAISDSGAGIPVEVMQHIFEPFYTTKPSGKGTGLGLSISADIVHKHHGEITVESEPGKGTTFTVCLPIQQEP